MKMVHATTGGNGDGRKDNDDSNGDECDSNKHDNDSENTTRLQFWIVNTMHDDESPRSEGRRI